MDLDERRASEAKALAEIAGKGAWICALDERGAALTSAGWAQEIARARDAGQGVYAVAIGGALLLCLVLQVHRQTVSCEGDAIPGRSVLALVVVGHRNVNLKCSNACLETLILPCR